MAILVRLCAASCLIITAAWGRNTDWRKVEALPDGTPVVVFAPLATACAFESADDRAIVCTPESTVFVPVSIRREDVRMVIALTRIGPKGLLVCAALGASFGALLGVAGAERSRGTAGLLYGGLGALLGSTVCESAPHRHIVYRHH